MLKPFLLLLLFMCVCLGCASNTAKVPRGLGVAGGRLAPCPQSPNCVSSQAMDDTHKIASFSFTGPTAGIMGRVAALLKETPRVSVVTQTDTYLHAECRTALFRFVDDLECFVDEDESTLHFRSASRTGYSDFGVNRKRVEALIKGLETR